MYAANADTSAEAQLRQRANNCENAVLRRENAALRGEIEALKSKHRELERCAEEQEKLVDVLKTQIGEWKAEVARLKWQLSVARDADEEKDWESEKLRTKVSLLKKEIRGLEKELLNLKLTHM